MTLADLSYQGQRSLGDMLEAERRMKAASDHAVKDLRQVLLDMAIRMDGKRIEEMRHRDPNAPGNWTAAEWRSFVNTIPVQSGWGAPATSGKKEDPARVSALVTEVKTLTAELNTANETIEKLETQLKKLEVNVLQAVAPGKPSASPASAIPSVAPEGVPAGAIAPASALLAEAIVMLERVYPKDGKDPELLTPYTGNRKGSDARNQLKRVWLATYLIGARGITSVQELNLLVSISTSTTPGNGSGKRVLVDMKSNGLIEFHEFRAASPSTTQQAVVFTSKGEELFRKLFPEQPLVKGEISRIKDLTGSDASRAALASILMIQARKRGYYVLASPKVKDAKVQPDVWVGRGEESFYVLIDDCSDRAAERWKGIASLNNGKTAIAATTKDALRKLVADCSVSNVHGVAIDLEAAVVESYTKIEEGKSRIWSEEF